jgi:peroxiredoxin Q/BCP
MSDVVEGSQVPSFELESADGPVRSDDLRGRKLVLYFYPKDDTSGCTREALDFTELASEFRAADTEVIGVSKDNVASHGKFVTKHALDVRLASDPDGSVVERFGSWVEKSMYGRKYMGIDRSTFLIDRDGRVARVWRKVKVPGHARQVLEAARSLA